MYHIYVTVLGFQCSMEIIMEPISLAPQDFADLWVMYSQRRRAGDEV